MKIDLEADDVQLLREVLTVVIRDLSPEIADTDNPAFRRDLRARRDHLQRIVDALGRAG